MFIIPICDEIAGRWAGDEPPGGGGQEWRGKAWVSPGRAVRCCKDSRRFGEGEGKGLGLIRRCFDSGTPSFQQVVSAQLTVTSA
ncbi:unnamed protein product [Mesocestoides corti]|uniref:Uncharacterized protein n=1 Tax=Mesocestoides corti TaxID=53468 RepID=A0A0R3UIL0_MESCO|nr:unnamed protein product [Mesocestoides corti]